MVKKESDTPDKSLPKWVKITKKRFDKIRNKVWGANNNNLQAR